MELLSIPPNAKLAGLLVTHKMVTLVSLAPTANQPLLVLKAPLMPIKLSVAIVIFTTISIQMVLHAQHALLIATPVKDQPLEIAQIVYLDTSRVLQPVQPVLPMEQHQQQLVQYALMPQIAQHA
jgi:hypothetical protein